MEKLRSSAVRAVVCAALLLAAAQCGWAQLHDGSVVGTVADASGAVVPEAKITATNIATGLGGSTVSSATGTYVVPGLLPGTYRVTCDKEGFKTTTVDNVIIDVATSVSVNIQLQVGATVQNVEVSASVVQMNTVNSNVDTSLENKVVEDLPLRVGVEGATVYSGRRQIESFAFVVPGAQGDAFEHRYDGGVDFSNEVLFDGVPQVSLDYPGFISLIAPPYESVDEFKVVTSVYTAQYGKGQGVESYHFKSGTNSLHGDLFEILRNTSLDARPFFSPTVAVEHQNEYGFTVGGPLYLPKIFDGRNRLFWNFAYSRFNAIQANPATLYTLPTSEMLNGNFQHLVDASGNMVPIYDPICGRGTASAHTCAATEARTTFPGNAINPNYFSPISTQVMALIPPAQDPTKQANNYVGGGQSLSSPDNEFDYKIDFLATPSNRFSFDQSRAAKYQGRWVGSAIDGPLGTKGAEPVTGDFWVMTFNHTFSPTLVNSFGSSFDLIDQVQDWGNAPEYINTKIDFPGIAFGNNFPSGMPPRYPGISFAGPIAPDAFLGMGQWGLHTRFLGYAFSDSVLWSKGRHTLTIGGDYRRTEENNGQCTSCVGDFTFDNYTTSNPTGADFLTSGHPFASFLLGIADEANRSSADPWRGFRTGYAGAYVEDDIKWNRKLTINVGLRWDFFLPLTELHDRLSFFDPNVSNDLAGGIPGGLAFVGTCSYCVGRSRYFNLHDHNFAPRLGFAYNLNDKTVIRSGFAIIYTNGGANYVFGPEVTNSFNAAYVANQLYQSPDGGKTIGYGSWDNPFPTAVYPGTNTGAVNGLVPDYFGPDLSRAPYMENWNLSIQRELPGRILLTTAYVGNRGIRLDDSLNNLDQSNPKYLALGNELTDNVTCLANGSCPLSIAAGVKIPYSGFTGLINQAIRPYPQYLGINSNNLAEDGYSTYHSLQISAQRRFTNGLQFLVSYTDSKQLGDTFEGFTTFNAGAINAYNRKAEKAISPYDIPQHLVVSGIYELPIGPGKPFVNKHGAVGKVVGGWQFGWILNYRSGTPVGIGASNQLDLFGGGNRPNVVAGANPQINRSNFDPSLPMYNINAFSQPADFTFGNAAKYLSNLRDWPSYDEDLSMLKRTTIHESVNIEFRFEAFNAFNRVLFSGGNTSYSPSNPAFGLTGGQANLPRLCQATLRLNF